MKFKFIFILANASIELIPKNIWRDKPVRRWSKFRRKHPRELLLDSTLHSPAIKKLSNYRDRGRPDILHRALLLITDSILNKQGLIKEIIIHTQRDEVYWVNPIIRPPRHYIRFLGLMEKLLIEKEIISSEGEVLIRKLGTLEEYLESDRFDYLIALTREGEKEKLQEVLKEINGENIAFAVGTLPHGSLPQIILDRANKKISLADLSLSTTYVLCKIISKLEDIEIS